MKVIKDNININRENQSLDFDNTLVVGEERNIIQKLITVIKRINNYIFFYSIYFCFLYLITFLLTAVVVGSILTNVIFGETFVQIFSPYTFALYLSICCLLITGFKKVQYDYDNVLVITNRKISKLSNPEERTQDNYIVDTEIRLDELENLEIAEDKIVFEETSGKKILIPNRDGISQKIQNKLYNI